MKLSRIFVCVALAVIVAGCGKMVSSDIPQKLNSGELLQAAGLPQRLAVVGSNFNEDRGPASVKIDSHVSVTIASGTSGELIAAYCQQVEQTIKNCGGEISGKGVTGSSNEVQEFTYHYVSGWDLGEVRVSSTVGARGEVEVVTYCYEHRK